MTVTVNGVTYTKWVSEGMGWQREDGGWMADEERPAMLDRIAELELANDGLSETINNSTDLVAADNARLREALREIEPLAKWYDDNYPRMGSMWDGGKRARAILSLAREALQGEKGNE